MIIFVILALMVLADGYRLDYQSMDNNMLRNMCEQNGVNYNNVEFSAIRFVNCIQYTADVSTFERELKQAESEDEYKEVFQKFCAKSPQIKSCYHSFLDLVMPCAGLEKNDITKITNVTDQVLDYVCFNGGEPITEFVVNRGPQCFSSKQFEMYMCAERYKANAMSTQQSMNLSAADGLLMCITEKLEMCDNPTASYFFSNISKIARDSVIQVLVSAANGMDRAQVSAPPVEYTEFEKASLLAGTRLPESLPSPMSHTSPRGNMMKNMCEQNGVNYNNIENSAVQFLDCVEKNFEVKMFERELTEVLYDSEYKEIFQKYCAKSPQLKTCYRTFFDVVIPCTGGEKYHATTITKNVADQILDYACHDGGEPITNFVINRGQTCFENKKFEIMMCLEYSKHTVMIMGPSMNISGALILGDNLLKCVAEKLEQCDNPTVSDFFANISRIVRGGFTQVRESAFNNKDTETRAKYLDNGTQPGTTWTSEEVTPPSPVNQLQTMCEQNGVDYKTVEAAIRKSGEYMQKNFNFNALMDVQNNSTRSKLAKEYCAKSSEVKTNYRATMNMMSPCLGPRGHNTAIISNNVNDQIIDFVCYNDGSRITKFFTEGGPQCIESKSFELIQCIKDSASSPWLMNQDPSLSVTEQFASYEALLDCIARSIETCDKTTFAEMLREMIKVIHRTVQRGAVEVINEPEESLRSKFSKMCEANGENYWIFMTIRDQAVTCLEEHLNMRISNQELMNAEYNGFYTKFFQRYCSRKTDPYLRTCIRTFTCGVSPCFGNEAQHYLASTVKAYDQILDYICKGADEGFENVSNFSANNGFKCVENNAHEILKCAEGHDVLDCTLKKLEACDSHKMFEAIGNIIRTSSLNQIKLISSYAEPSSKRHHFKSSGDINLSFNADIVI